MKFGGIVITLLILAIVYIGCDDTISQEEIDKTVFPTVNVSFNQHVQQILNAKCNSAGCHNDQDAADNLSLTQWTYVMNVVVPRAPENSILLTHLHEDYVPPLSDNQRACITAWINEGATNN